MSIYLWISTITSIAFVLVIFLLIRKFLAGKDNGLIIFSVVLAGIIVSAALYVSASMHGTQILSSRFVTEYQIKEETFKTTDKNTANYLNAAYAFYAENGVQYQLRGTELLREPESDPVFIGIYTCEAVDGYSWCYLKKGTVVRHTLTQLSHDGSEGVSYEKRQETAGSETGTESDTDGGAGTESDADGYEAGTDSGTENDGNSFGTSTDDGTGDGNNYGTGTDGGTENDGNSFGTGTDGGTGNDGNAYGTGTENDGNSYATGTENDGNSYATGTDGGTESDGNGYGNDTDGSTE